MKERGRINNKEYRELTGLSDGGARKDLKPLLEKGILKQNGKGKNTFFTLKVGECWRIKLF